MPKTMSWNEIRKTFPDTFVLLDKYEEKEINSKKRIVTKGIVVLTSDNGKEIYKEYIRRGKLQNMTFGCTKWKELEVEEIPFLGLRFENE